MNNSLHFAFDIGHSSIGWAVLRSLDAHDANLLGCGAVIFQADDCLASERRGFRRQRRHVRATRLRIARLKSLLSHLGVLSETELNAVTSSSPWLLAARVLRGGPSLSWRELWDVLRWYAHNRGYDGNKAWSRQEIDAAAEREDAEKVQNARTLLDQYGTRSMAETWCAVCGLDPLGTRASCALPGDKRPKALNAAFPREIVEGEVARVLRSHIGVLPGVDESLVSAVMTDWTALACPAIRLPLRYRGGLLFGQLVPRFENRIIARCPIAYEAIYRSVLDDTGDIAAAKAAADKQAKVPAANCPEFFRYRWAMQVANVLLTTPGGMRRLTAEQRRALDETMRDRGGMTRGEFKDAVRALTGGAPDNLDQMLLHEDADKALVLDPVRRAMRRKEVASLLDTQPERLLKRAAGQMRRGKRLTLGAIRVWAGEDGGAFDAEVERQLDAANTKRGRKTAPPTREGLLSTELRVEFPGGRAPHSREVMRAVADFVFAGEGHPAEEGGPLFRSEAIRKAQLQRAIDEQTNNHLVRHRLRILERLHRDLLATYAKGEDVTRVTIEVNRDLRELSGKKAKEIAQDIGLRLSNFKSVAAKLERELVGKGIAITPGLIRKARVAEDLGWTCPYTGQTYDVLDLVHRRVDKDHIIPRSVRPSDGLDALVITFSEVNRMKGKRTAVKFIEEDGGKAVEGRPQLTLRTPGLYSEAIRKLETFKGHEDDKRRKRNRRRLLELRDYVEKEFVPRDLTQTSQLVRLGAQILEREYEGREMKPVITSLPGSVTGAVRRSWDLLGCLGAANPLVMDPATNEPRTKTEIRDITHLHHALDACTLAFTSLVLPGKGRDGSAWELLVRRRLNAEQQTKARELFKNCVEFEKDGTLRLIDLPKAFKEQIRQRIAERRVVQHLPSDMSGLRAELNAWRVVNSMPDEDGKLLLRQRIRQPDGRRPFKERREKPEKLVGLRPGKLQKLKGALVIGDNYGLALDPEPTIIPFHKVWNRLRELREKNGGKPVRVLRNGMLIEVPSGRYAGAWKIFSVKNNTSGIAVDMARPDVVRPMNKTENSRINVLLASLLRDGMKLQPVSLCGIAPKSEAV
ncbi:MAG TPA: HNH endonuclease domain-containing protein [Chthoniobacterales bacterium]